MDMHFFQQGVKPWRKMTVSKSISESVVGIPDTPVLGRGDKTSPIGPFWPFSLGQFTQRFYIHVQYERVQTKHKTG